MQQQAGAWEAPGCPGSQAPAPWGVGPSVGPGFVWQICCWPLQALPGKGLTSLLLSLLICKMGLIITIPSSRGLETGEAAGRRTLCVAVKGGSRASCWGAVADKLRAPGPAGLLGTSRRRLSP